MKKKIWLFSFFFLFISNLIFSQVNSEIITFSEGSYFYQNKYYQNQKLSPVLESNPKAIKVYNEYLTDRASVPALGGGSVLGVIVGIILLKNDPCKNALDPDECDLFISMEQILGGAVVVGSVITGGVALVRLDKSKRNLKEAVNIFNTGAIAPIGFSPIELNLQTTNHGLGLVLNF